MRAQLERLILEDPDKFEPYLVLADHLTSIGERHGQLIAEQHASPVEKPVILADSPAASAYPEVIGEALREVADRVIVEWRLGYFATAEITGLDPVVPDVYADPQEWWVDMPRAELDAAIQAQSEVQARVVEALYQSPASFMLRTLNVRGTRRSDLQPVIQRMSEFQAPVRLETISLGFNPAVRGLTPGDLTVGGHSVIGRIDGMIRNHPALRDVALHGRAARVVDELEADVETLRVHCSDGATLVGFEKTMWPRLRELAIWTSGEPGSLLGLGPVGDEKLFGGSVVPGLRSLTVLHVQTPDALFDRLIESRLLHQLSSLTLDGAFRDSDIRILVDAKERLQHLTTLDVQDRRLSTDGKFMLWELRESLSRSG